ncbi:MAG: PEGA domain-containing protein, partial [Candidatus Electrothrix sp. AUS4]|nr:PEGA domain-containing protein [Candidatus Electrothrix sp. AUS4]
YQHVSEKVSLTADLELSLTLKQLFLVTVYTNLDLSTVMLDGKEVGKAGSNTPAALSIPGGKYLINISNPQAAAPVEQQLEVTKDQRLSIDMPLPKLTVNVNKAGTILIVDGKEYKVSGKQLHLELPQGSHHISAKKEGYATLQREVLVRDGAQTFFELLPPTYPLSVRSNIDKTAIYVKCKDGKEYSGFASPKEPFQFRASAGTCTVSANREGYQGASKPTSLPTEKEITLNLIPEERKKTQPPEEQVKAEKNVPVATEQPVAHPAEQNENKKDKPAAVKQPTEQSEAEKDKAAAIEQPVEQPTEQPEIEEQESPLIEIRPRKVKVKPEAAQQPQKTKSKAAPRQPTIEKTKKQPVPQKKKEQPAVQPVKKPTPAKKEADPLQLKQKKKDCQYEISIGMPELCDE